MSERFDPSRLVPALARWALLLLLLHAPATANACPGCMQQGKARSAVPVLMAFMGVPFAIFGGVVLVLRRRGRGTAARRPAASAPGTGAGQMVYLEEPAPRGGGIDAHRPAA